MDTNPTRSGFSLFHPGIGMIAVALYANFACMAFFYSYSVFFKPLAEAFSLSRTEVSAGLMAYMLITALASPFAGQALDRFPVQRVMCVGALFMGSGFVLLSQITAQWQLYAILGLFIGIGFPMLGMGAASKLMANWFDAHRGLAMGIAMVGISVAGVCMPMLSAWLIETFGWRSAYLMIGLGILILVAPVVLLFIINRPEDIGLKPDGGLPAPKHSPPAIDLSAEQNYTTVEILRTSNFWLIACMTGISGGIITAILTNLVPYLTDNGLAPLQAASLLSIGSILGIFGKVWFGWLADNIAPRLALWILQGIQLVGIVLFMQGSEYWTFLLAACVYGLGLGGTAPLQGALTALAFGRLSFGRAFGMMMPVAMPFTLGGLFLMGWVYDTQGSYLLGFQVFTGVLIFAALLVTQLKLAGRHETVTHEAAETA